jgi:hypothetical protein
MFVKAARQFVSLLEKGMHFPQPCHPERSLARSLRQT